MIDAQALIEAIKNPESRKYYHGDFEADLISVVAEWETAQAVLGATYQKYILVDGDMTETSYGSGGDDGEVYYLASDVDSTE